MGKKFVIPPPKRGVRVCGDCGQEESQPHMADCPVLQPCQNCGRQPTLENPVCCDRPLYYGAFYVIKDGEAYMSKPLDELIPVSPLSRKR